MDTRELLVYMCSVDRDDLIHDNRINGGKKQVGESRRTEPQRTLYYFPARQRYLTPSTKLAATARQKRAVALILVPWRVIDQGLAGVGTTSMRARQWRVTRGLVPCLLRFIFDGLHK